MRNRQIDTLFEKEYNEKMVKLRPLLRKTPSVSAEAQAVKTPSKIWERISKISIYLLVFLLPIFFLPWTANVLDFNKQVLLIFLVFISLFCWLLKSLIEGKINLNFSLLNLPILIFLVILTISTFLSASPYGSFWGWPLNIAPSFLTIFGFILLYFLIINIFQKKEEIFGLLITLIGSSFLVALFGGLQIFGKFIFPFDFSKFTSFNTIGTVNSLGIFLAALLPLIISLIFISKRVIKFLFFLFGLSFFLLLFVVNFRVAWVALLIGTAAILIFGITRRDSNPPSTLPARGGAPIFQANWLTLPMFILVIALFFGFLRISLPGLPATPLEVSPSQKATFNIASQTLKESPNSLFLGSGPGTFVYNYSKFKSEAINQTAFWAVRFNSGASEILDKLATTGILGLLSWLGILGVLIWLGFKGLIKTVAKDKEDSFWILGLGVFASWLVIVVGQFLYPANLSLGFLFWIFTASFIGLGDIRVKSWGLQPSSIFAIGVSFIFIFVLILGLGLFFLGGQRYIAEVRYLQGLRAWQRGDNQAAINYLSRAINQTGGKQDNYLRDLSQVYLFRINEELQKTGISQEEILRVVTSLVGNTVNSAKAATDISPKNVANWAVRGFVYRNLMNLITGADQWAIKSYEEALKLEPTNPYLYVEIGQVYLAKNEMERARENFQKALDLKSDYPPAHFQIAMVYAREGKIAEAIGKLEETKGISPFDVGLAFQLGVLYYNDNQFDKAKGEFERAVSFDPNYSNARYFLGLIYDKEGKKKLAIEQFEKIERLNPDNQEVKKILANLRGGKPALEGIAPGQPPIEEKPPERLEK